MRRTTTSGDTIEVSYDGDGNRVEKRVNGIPKWYLVDDNNHTGYAQVVEELGSDLSGLVVNTVYSYGHDLISQTKFDPIAQSLKSTAFFSYDGHGNVRFLTDSDGAITDTYDYDAFGLLIDQQVFDSSVGAFVPATTLNLQLQTLNSYLYTGEQYDSDLGMYFLRARYMEPDRGRFWTMDSYEGRSHDPISLHKYLYANSDPVNHIDPSGMFSLLELEVVQAIQAKMKATYVSVATVIIPRTYLMVARLVNAFSLKFSDTIARYSRPYYESRWLIEQIIRSGKITKDPGGVLSAVRYQAYGWYNNSYGFYELVIDLKTRTILHFVFKSVK